MSFVVSEKEIKRFMPPTTMHEQQGVSFCFSSPPEVLRKLIPVDLEPLANVITGYVGMIKGSNFSGPFTESGLGVPVKVKKTGDTGTYFLTYLVHGPGGFNATAIGRDYMGTPKKYADSIECARAGRSVHAKVVRKGVTLIELEADIDGEYNTVTAEQVLGHAPSGTVAGNTLYYRFNVDANEDGSVGFSNGHIVKLDRETDIRTAEMGKLKSIRLGSSENDPYGDFEICQPLGVLFYDYKETRVHRVAKVADVNVYDSLSCLLSARYDRGVFGDTECCLTTAF